MPKNGGFSSTPEANDVLLTPTCTECDFSFHITSKFEDGFLPIQGEKGDHTTLEKGDTIVFSDLDIQNGPCEG